jgi:hypothetical protein
MKKVLKILLFAVVLLLFVVGLILGACNLVGAPISFIDLMTIILTTLAIAAGVILGSFGIVAFGIWLFNND